MFFINLGSSANYILQVLATDRDIGSNANITYTISSGNHGNAFSIDDVTGQIKVAGGLDRETFSRYDLVVVATDGMFIVLFQMNAYYGYFIFWILFIKCAFKILIFFSKFYKKNIINFIKKFSVKRQT